MDYLHPTGEPIAAEELIAVASQYLNLLYHRFGVRIIQENTCQRLLTVDLREKTHSLVMQTIQTDDMAVHEYCAAEFKGMNMNFLFINF